MKTIVLATLAMLVLGGLAAFLLTASQQLAYEAYATTGARVSEPGHNLVGKRWNGQTDTKPAGRPG
jgi:hypothetical protein